MAIKFTNNASSKLTQALTTSATSMQIKAEDVSKFPVLGAEDYCLLTIVGDNGNHEIVKVTNISSAGTCTIERAQDSTTAKEWPVDNRVELRITAEYLNSTTTSEDVLSLVSPIEENISSINNNISTIEDNITNIENDISSISSTQEEIINTTIPSLPDNVTISFEGDKLQVKDIAIGGDSSDLASNRGLFECVNVGGFDYNNLTTQGFYSVNQTGSTNGPGFGSKLVVYRAANSNLVLQVAFGAADPKLATRYSFDNGDTWSNWAYYINDNTIGDGIKVNNGIISVPEYEGATSSATATSGLVPPATSTERNNFLRGDGTWQQVDLSDYALKTELTKYLPLTGGSLFGVLNLNTPDPADYIGALYALNDTNGKRIALDTYEEGDLGAYLALHKGSCSLLPGGFSLGARNSAGSLVKVLVGQTNGLLLWDNKNIVRSVNGVNADASGNVTLTTGMPVGSIYVQFSGQSAPSDLFGGTWSNISSSFAGLFFRAEGGKSAAFGSAQEDGAPDITGWTEQVVYTQNCIGYDAFKTKSVGGCSVSGSGHTLAQLEFVASRSSSKYGAADEVRPVNSTIRIWKRTA